VCIACRVLSQRRGDYYGAMAVAARRRSIYNSTRPWEAGCPRPPVVSIIYIIERRLLFIIAVIVSFCRSLGLMLTHAAASQSRRGRPARRAFARDLDGAPLRARMRNIDTSRSGGFPADFPVSTLP
jgi:hypothetical protein